MKTYQVAVFVTYGKRKWLFRTTTRDIDPTLPGCNLWTVRAATAGHARRKALAIVQARMDLNSKRCPTDVECDYGGAM